MPSRSKKAYYFGRSRIAVRARMITLCFSYRKAPLGPIGPIKDLRALRPFFRRSLRVYSLLFLRFKEKGDFSKTFSAISRALGSLFNI